MVPVVIPTPPQPEIKEEKESAAPSVLAGFLWAVILLLAFWFITGGYEKLQ